MSLRTTFFNLLKLIRTDRYSIDEFNENMDIIDEEMHRPPLTVNETEPDPETRNIQIDTVPLADNLTSDEAQINTGTFIIRTSGGEASIADGSAWLSDIRGNMSKSGYSPESLNMTVTPAAREEGVNPITATIDRETFFDEVSGSGTMIFAYASGWNYDPATYGITVDGTPIDGDIITVTYVKGNRGTITVATPTSFVSTGWNLYNHAAGYARVVNYSDEYGFMIDGTYTALEFSETLSGTKTTITPVDGFFTINADGYVWVTGGNETDTAIWMTWSDWTDEPNGGVFEAYTTSTVDLSGVMVNFPDGLMRIGNNYDEINLNTGRAYSRIQKMEYTTENQEAVIASGVEYDTDENYIYAVRQFPVTYTISLDGEYTVSDHGLEMYVGTNLPVTSSSLYGNDLKNKLRRDVVTISQQTLTSAQQAQILTNIGAGSAAAVNSNSEAIAKLDSNTNSTNDILADALTSNTTRFFSGTGSSYTGTVPNGNYKYGTFMVNRRYGTKTVLAQSANNDIAINTYDGSTWTGWQELETAKKYSVASKTTSSIAPNNNGSVMVDIPSDGSVIKEIIPYGFLPSDHWNSSLIFVSVNNSTRTVAYRCVGSGNSQTFDMRYAVIYE